ncbi:hypothetical protein [Marinomonas algicola]|uniref:hypothetical protein n=1 Tax=Marinomonas algicola TaxID=2773454 RepID=UPI001748E56C|nr:hypothetical protein [Marinomonas algicola]
MKPKNDSPSQYETVDRSSVSISNAKGTASFTITKKNNIYENEIKSFEYMLSLVSNAAGFSPFSVLLDVEDILNLAYSLNRLRVHAFKKVTKSTNITICSRGGRNFTLQLKDMSQHKANDPICLAYFNFSKEEKYFLPLSSLSASSIYAKCIEFLAVNHGCVPSELPIFYPFLFKAEL